MQAEKTCDLPDKEATATAFVFDDSASTVGVQTGDAFNMQPVLEECGHGTMVTCITTWKSENRIVGVKFGYGGPPTQVPPTFFAVDLGSVSVPQLCMFGITL